MPQFSIKFHLLKSENIKKNPNYKNNYIKSIILFEIIKIFGIKKVFFFFQKKKEKLYFLTLGGL
jgi:methyltransferase-like protein